MEELSFSSVCCTVSPTVGQHLRVGNDWTITWTTVINVRQLVLGCSYPACLVSSTQIQSTVIRGWDVVAFCFNDRVLCRRRAVVPSPCSTSSQWSWLLLRQTSPEESVAGEPSSPAAACLQEVQQEVKLQRKEEMRKTDRTFGFNGAQHYQCLLHFLTKLLATSVDSSFLFCFLKLVSVLYRPDRWVENEQNYNTIVLFNFQNRLIGRTEG